MASPPSVDRSPRKSRGLVNSGLQLVASLKLAVVMIVVLAIVLTAATFLEAAKGREYAQWYVYGSAWFIALLALLAANILAASLVRFPWKTRHLGFLVTHAGLLLLLLGSIQTFVAGIDGRLSFEEGEDADSIFLTDRSELTLSRQGPKGQVLKEFFSFTGGAVDWPEGRELDFPSPQDVDISDRVDIKVLKFYRHARRVVNLVEDKSKQSGPALRLAITDNKGKLTSEGWKIASQDGSASAMGVTRIAIFHVPVASMLDDFFKPPGNKTGDDKTDDDKTGDDKADSAGILSIHYDGKVRRIPVKENIGKKVSLDGSDIAVQIVQYIPDPRTSGRGQFASRSDEPKDPMLELMMYLPGEDRPQRQLAFATQPLLNLDGVYGRSSPVKFWYHHASVPASSGVEFLQTPDDKLYCRVGIDEKYVSRGEVKEGDKIEVPGGYTVSIRKHLRHARQDVTFCPVELAAGETIGPEAAALVEIATESTTNQVWIRRNDDQYGFRRIVTPQGPLTLDFGYEKLPLGFTLKLLDFQRLENPGGMGDASFASLVQLIDSVQGIDQQKEISMNNPLVHGKFTFYQSSFQELPGGKEVSVLSVTYDPGRFMKYLGSLMICVGIFFMYYMKIPLLKKLSSAFSRKRNT